MINNVSPWGRHLEYKAVSYTDGLFCCRREWQVSRTFHFEPAEGPTSQAGQ